MDNTKNKPKKIEIKYKGKVYTYDFKSLKSLQAETANEIMQWYNDAKKRLNDVQLKELQRSDVAEVKDAIVAHLVREVTKEKNILPYSPDMARSETKQFMADLPFCDYGAIKDEIIRDFFLSQGRSHLATIILREKPKQSLTPENMQFLVQMMGMNNSKSTQEEKSSESPQLTVASSKEE